MNHLASKDKPYVKTLSLSAIQVYSTFDPLIKYRWDLALKSKSLKNLLKYYNATLVI